MIREQNVICMDNHKRPLRTEKINLNGALFDAQDNSQQFDRNKITKNESFARRVQRTRLIYYFFASSEARIKSAKSGCGRFGRDLNSGWN